MLGVESISSRETSWLTIGGEGRLAMCLPEFRSLYSPGRSKKAFKATVFGLDMHRKMDLAGVIICACVGQQQSGCRQPG